LVTYGWGKVLQGKEVVECTVKVCAKGAKLLKVDLYGFDL